MMDQRQKDALDRYITGNYGEDQLKGADMNQLEAYKVAYGTIDMEVEEVEDDMKRGFYTQEDADNEGWLTDLRNARDWFKQQIEEMTKG